MTAAKMLKILFMNNLILCTRYSHQTQHKLYLYLAFINWSNLHSFSPWNVKAFSPEIVTNITRARLSFEKVMITDLCICSSLTNDSEGLRGLLLYYGSGTTTSTNCILPHWNVSHRTVLLLVYSTHHNYAQNIINHSHLSLWKLRHIQCQDQEVLDDGKLLKKAKNG